MTRYLTHIKQLLSSKETFQVVLSFFLFAWVLFVATPFDIIVSNAEEYTQVTGSSILWNGIFYAISAFLSLVTFYIVVSLIFNSYVRKFIFFIVIPLSISFWLNSTFLVGVYGEFDGRGNLQIEPFGLLNWVQIVAFLIIFIFALYFRNRPQIITYIIASICFISLLTGTINILSKFADNTISHGVEDNKFFSYSLSKPNVLIIWLDEYQSDYFEYVLDNRIKKKLNGFIWFKDNAANFPTTIAASGGIFAAKVYDNSEPLDGFYKKIGKYSVAEKIKGIGGQTHAFKPPAYSNYLWPKNSFIEFEYSNFDTNHEAYILLLNYSIFRSTPDVFKVFLYHDEKWLVQGKESIQPSFKAESLHSLRHFSEKHLIAKKNHPITLKYFFSALTHSPTVFNENCEYKGKISSTIINRSKEGLCALHYVSKIIDNLKKQGVFDNTMIIITADHGSVYKPEFFEKKIPYAKAAATLLIKPLYSNVGFRISNIPAQLSDIPKTIADHLNIDNSYSGINLLSDNIPNNRARVFNHYVWSKEYHNLSKNRLPPVTKYQITGPLNDPKSWKSLKTLASLTCEVTLAFSNADSQQYYFDDLSGQEAWGRWSDGGQAEIEFQTEPDCKAKSVTFNLKAFVTPKNPEQTASVFINDESVGDIQISVGEAQPKQFTFALPDAQDNRYTIRFEIDKPTMPKSVGVNDDTRELGFGFIDMKLSPDEVSAQ